MTFLRQKTLAIFHAIVVTLNAANIAIGTDIYLHENIK
jgi:hypothetical protein